MRFILSIILMFICSVGFSIEFVDNLDMAMKISKDLQKNTLIIFSIDGCMYCEMLKQDIVNITTANDYVVCVVDSEQEKNLSRKMKIRKWPTSIIIPSGSDLTQESSRLSGYPDRSKYNEWLQSNLKR